jgi:hypothetical protein
MQWLRFSLDSVWYHKGTIDAPVENVEAVNRHNYCMAGPWLGMV